MLKKAVFGIDKNVFLWHTGGVAKQVTIKRKTNIKVPPIAEQLKSRAAAFHAGAVISEGAGAVVITPKEEKFPHDVLRGFLLLLAPDDAIITLDDGREVTKQAYLCHGEDQPEALPSEPKPLNSLPSLSWRQLHPERLFTS